MKVNLRELQRIFEKEILEDGSLAKREAWIGGCSTLINQLYGEPLFLGLFAEALSNQTGCAWTYKLGDAFVAKQSGQPANRKRLDGYIIGENPISEIPRVLVCEVKGWSDHCLGGYYIPTKSSKRLTHPSKGDYYWRSLDTHFSRGESGAKDGALSKLDANWDLPAVGKNDADLTCGISLAMFHLLEPPEGSERVIWPFNGTKSIFWFNTPNFQNHQRVLVFSVAKYLLERKSEFFELNDDLVERKLEALRRTGAI